MPPPASSRRSLSASGVDTANNEVENVSKRNKKCMNKETNKKNRKAWNKTIVSYQKVRKLSLHEGLKIMKILFLFISCTFLSVPAHCQKNTAQLEQQVINRAIKGSMGVEYINADHSAVNGKIFIARTLVSPVTYLFPPQVPDSSEYHIIS